MLQIATPAARNTDPSTSKESATYIDTSGLRAHQQRQVVAAVRQWPGCTSYELAKHMHADRVMPARRLRELVEAGEVVEGPKRQCTISGRTALTWLPVLHWHQLDLPAAA